MDELAASMLALEIITRIHLGRFIGYSRFSRTIGRSMAGVSERENTDYTRTHTHAHCGERLVKSTCTFSENLRTHTCTECFYHLLRTYNSGIHTYVQNNCTIYQHEVIKHTVVNYCPQTHADGQVGYIR